jgi:hypothetical protein
LIILLILPCETHDYRKLEVICLKDGLKVRMWLFQEVQPA